MPPRRRPPEASNAGLYLLAFVLVLLVVVLAALWVRRQPPDNRPGETPQQTADLISDYRLIWGGMPKARPGSGSEVEFKTLKNIGYIAGYSESRKDPLWVAYRVFKNPSPYSFPRPSGGFLIDRRTDARVNDGDYARSGYDRGHMAPNSAIMRDYGREAQVETFLLTNICPQSPALNQQVWAALETRERQFADRFEEVWVIDGPIFGDLNKGNTPRLASGIAVPEAFYKILIDEERGKPRMMAVIMPQNVQGKELPQQFLRNVRDIEEQTHLDFFWKLDDATEADLESKVGPMWSTADE